MHIVKFLIVLVVSASVFANEEPEKKAEKKDLPPWVEIQNKLSGYESRIRQLRGNINSLIIQKSQLPKDSPKVKEIVDEMVRQHKTLRKVVEDYDKQSAILKFRYPEKGAKANRKYEKIEVKSLEEMETELGTEGRLNRNLNTMRAQYGKRAASTTSTTIQVQVAPQEKSIEDAGSVILKK